MMNLIHNIRDLMPVSRRVEKHLRYRKVATPGRSRNAATTLSRMSAYNPAFTVWVYIRNILFWMIPALLLHGPLLVIQTAHDLAVGTELNVPGSNMYVLVIYGAALLLGLRRGSDQVAYYNIHAVVGRENLNYKAQQLLPNTKSPNFKQLDKQRKRFNRISLFPTTKELAVEEQVYQHAMNSHLQNSINAAIKRRAALDLGNKEMEHFAAKAIADQKQQQGGGKNEYDAMVARYKHRAAPQIKEIIARVQDSY